jgi:hypothetical protein
MTHHDFRPSRRAFLAGSGLVIGFAVMPKGLRRQRKAYRLAALPTCCRSIASSRSAPTTR